MKFLTLSLRAVALLACLGVGDLVASQFHVGDYGAKGDGQNDDGPAIRQAIAAAVEAGPGSKVIFEPKRYRLARAPVDYHIVLTGANGLTIEGNGAELISTPWNGLVKLEECEDVTVRGLVLDFDPLPFTQGTITEVDAEAGSFLLEIQDGYDNPVEVYRKIAEKKPNWGWGVCMDPKERIRKPEAHMHYYMETVEAAGNGLLKVTLADKALPYASELNQGDRFVITMKYGRSIANFLVRRSSDCHLENNTFYTGRYGMTHSLSDNHGPIYIRGVKIIFKPGTDHLITTPKDGFHCKHSAVGPIIEDGVYEGLLDDAISIAVNPYWIRKDFGDNRYLIADLQYLPRKGNRLMAYRPNPGTITDNLVVQSVEPQDAPNGMQGKWAVITLNQSIPNPGLHQGRNLFPGGVEKMGFTGLYNIDASGRDYVIRGNTFKAQRRHAILARPSGGLIEDNIIEGVGGSGISINNEIRSFYSGPIPSDIVIRNNTFTDTFFDPIKIYTHGKGAVARNIRITGNRITGWHTNPRNPKSAAAIYMRNVSGAVIQDNTIGPGAAPPSISQPIRLQACEDISSTNNHIASPE
jgi:hypothetical protein